MCMVRFMHIFPMDDIVQLQNKQNQKQQPDKKLNFLNAWCFIYDFAFSSYAIVKVMHDSVYYIFPQVNCVLIYINLMIISQRNIFALHHSLFVIGLSTCILMGFNFVVCAKTLYTACMTITVSKVNGILPHAKQIILGLNEDDEIIGKLLLITIPDASYFTDIFI